MVPLILPDFISHRLAKMNGNFLTRPERSHEVHVAYHPLCLMQRKKICYRAQPEPGSQAEAVKASLFDNRDLNHSYGAAAMCELLQIAGTAVVYSQSASE